MEPTAQKTQWSVLVVGNTYLDEFVEVPQFPVPDGKFSITNIRSDLGGSATNACCGFQALGNSSKILSVIGKDDCAKRIFPLLQAKNLNTQFIKQIEGVTGRTIILLTPEGQSTKLSSSGVGRELEHHLLPIYDLQLFQHIHMASVSLQVLKSFIGLGKQEPPLRTTLSLDLGSSLLREDPNVLCPLFNLVDFVFLNEYSLERMYSVNVTNEHWVERLQDQLKSSQESSKVTLIVTLGKDGAYAITSKHFVFEPSWQRNVVIRDTTGAGDAFASAFLTFRLRDLDSLELALKKAHIAAAHKISVLGGPNGHLATDDVVRILSE